MSRCRSATKVREARTRFWMLAYRETLALQRSYSRSSHWHHQRLAAAVVLSVPCFVKRWALLASCEASRRRRGMDSHRHRGGEETGYTFTGRTARWHCRVDGQEATVFHNQHGGFLGPEFGYAGKLAEFAEKFREVLDGR